MVRTPHPKRRHHRRPQALLSALTKSSKSMRADIEIPEPMKDIHPGDDFYHYCNGKWLYHTHLPSYNVTYSVSDELEDVLDGYLFDIANRAAAKAVKGAPTATEEEIVDDCVGRLIMSAMRPEVQRFSVEYAKRGLRSLACMRDSNDVAKTLGQMVRYSVPTLIEMEITPEHDPLKGGDLHYFINLGPGRLGLEHPRYYLEGSGADGAPTILKGYADLLKFVSKEFDLGSDLSNGISIETEIARPLAELGDGEFEDAFTLGELERKFKNIPWRIFLEAVGIPVEMLTPLKQIHLYSSRWFEILDKFFKTFPIEHWYLLTSIHTAVHALQYLPAPFDQQHFEVFGKGLYGQARKNPQHILTLKILKENMSDYMGFLFTVRLLKASEKADAVAFVKNILESTKRRISGLAWMDLSTKKKSIKKLEALKLSVYYSEPVTAPKGIPNLQTDNFLANIYLINGATTDKFIRRLKTQSDVGKTWDEAPYSVNAFYYHNLNQLVIPAGSFFWPFYDHKRLGWSYGGIGAVIGHEIIHGFDEEGKEYDEKGKQRPLWSATDEKKFLSVVEDLVRLFNQGKVAGQTINGKLTASENLADLGGLAISLGALESELRGASAVKRLAELREFFWSYAVSWRTKEREKKSLQSLYFDRHAPPKFRVNFIVPHFDAWYEAFNVITTNTLYLPPEERIQIF